MKRIRPLAASLFLGLISVATTRAASITVNFASDGFLVMNELSANLSGGLPTIDGDGFVLQLGYYSGATAGNNFLGTWVPLTGEGSANTGGAIVNSSPSLTFNQTTIGDRKNEGGTDGEFYLSVKFDTANANTSSSLPGSTTIPLAIRFYNASTIAGATHYNVVSRDTWLWVTPNDPEPFPIDMSLSQTGLEWESTAQGQSVANEFKTTLVIVPEPSSLALALVGVVGLAVARRRRSA